MTFANAARCKFELWGLLALLLTTLSVGQGEAASTTNKAILDLNYTKIANNGTSLPDAATLGSAPTEWGCTRHNASNLMFEVKIVTPGSLRHAANTYSWLNTNASSNGGNSGLANSGACSGSACDTQAYVAAVNAAGLCGASNWRLPTPSELQRIVSSGAGTGTAVVNSAFFPNVAAGRYWTQTNVAGIPTHAWSIGFDDGNALPKSKTLAYRIMLVR